MCHTSHTRNKCRLEDNLEEDPRIKIPHDVNVMQTPRLLSRNIYITFILCHCYTVCNRSITKRYIYITYIAYIYITALKSVYIAVIRGNEMISVLITRSNYITRHVYVIRELYPVCVGNPEYIHVEIESTLGRFVLSTVGQESVMQL